MQSPRYPTVDEARERLHKAREKTVARSFGAVFMAGLVVAPLGGGGPALVASGIGLIGFIATCFYAGNRQYNRMNRGQ